jgi:hypothetical protein
MKSVTDDVYKPKDLYGIPVTHHSEDVGRGLRYHDHVAGKLIMPFKNPKLYAGHNIFLSLPLACPESILHAVWALDM